MIKALRPQYKPLSKPLLKKILTESYALLEKYGVFVENKEAKNLLKKAGAQINEDENRVFIKQELVEKALSTTPSMIELYDRSGEQKFILGGDSIHFDPGSAAVTVLDHKSKSQREAETEDLVQFVRITDRLENIDFQSTGIVSSDVPEIIGDSYRLYIGLQYSSKPVVTGTFRVEGFKPMHDMLMAVRGSKNKLKQKPLAIFDACPSPPLKWSSLTAQSLIDSARAGIPSELISMGMTGATSPVTLTGTLVQHTAENLSGLVICQLAASGSPVIFGGSPASFDMRKGTTPMGAIETMMIDAAYAQIGKHLNLPTHAYMGLSDSKINDNQAGLESGIGAVLASLAGINVISGPGMMDFESCQSLEKLVVDNEICGMAKRLIRGISQRDEPLALDLFKDITPETQFLSKPNTRKWYRQEHIFPDVIDRDTYDEWAGKGNKSISDRATDRIEEILKQPVSLVDTDIQKELKKVMLSDAKNNGLSTLPKVGSL
ncbi:MAG: trimethylamine methyltransferase family protein [Acidobacteriota bacterium]